MTYFRLSTLVVPCALVLGSVGCPSSDPAPDSGDVADTGDDLATTTTGPSLTDGANSPDTGDTGDTGDSSGLGGSTSADSSGGGDPCTAVSCDPDEECVDGTCVPLQLPAVCDAPVVVSHPDCERCVGTGCCPQIEACFGDGGDGRTACAALRTCIETSCTDTETEEEFTACVQRSCEETADALPQLLAVFECVGACVYEPSPGSEDSCGVGPR